MAAESREHGAEELLQAVPQAVFLDERVADVVGMWDRGRAVKELHGEQ